MISNKLSLPVVILLSSIIIGGFYYASQLNKQESIEQYQDKEYTAKRKDECYDLYEKEAERWSNVKGSHYDVFSDKCVITYVKKEQDPAECSKQQKEYGKDVGFGPKLYCEITFTKEY